MTTVDLADEGGVASYVRAVKPHFELPVDYLTVGARPGHAGGVRRAVVRLVRDWWQFSRAVRSGHYDLVHLNPSLERRALLRDGVLVLLARSARVPVVVFIHGWVPECVASLDRRVPGFLFAKTFLSTAHVIVLAETFETQLRGWGRRGPVSVLGTAIEDSMLAVPRAGAGVPDEPGPCVLLFLARLEASKGAFTSLRAHRLLLSRGHDVELVIAGDGPSMAEIRAEAGPGVRLLGYVRGPDKLAALEGADIFLFPTEYGEGLPICVLEAMAHGLPIVSRRVGGIPDVIVEGEMGLLTDSVDPAVFADLVEDLLGDQSLRRRMGEANRIAVGQRFTGAAASRDLEAIYRSVSEQVVGRVG